MDFTRPDFIVDVNDKRTRVQVLLKYVSTNERRCCQKRQVEYRGNDGDFKGIGVAKPHNMGDFRPKHPILTSILSGDGT